MADIIDFKPKRKELELVVEKDDDPQLFLEVAIVQLWKDIGGFKLKEMMKDDTVYHVFFLQFSDTCFQAMEDKTIEVFEDGNTEIEAEFMETIQATMRLLMEAEGSNDNMPTEH